MTFFARGMAALFIAGFSMVYGPATAADSLPEKLSRVETLYRYGESATAAERYRAYKDISDIFLLIIAEHPQSDVATTILLGQPIGKVDTAEVRAVVNAGEPPAEAPTEVPTVAEPEPVLEKTPFDPCFHMPPAPAGAGAVTVVFNVEIGPDGALRTPPRRIEPETLDTASRRLDVRGMSAIEDCAPYDQLAGSPALKVSFSYNGIIVEARSEAVAEPASPTVAIAPEVGSTAETTEPTDGEVTAETAASETAEGAETTISAETAKPGATPESAATETAQSEAVTESATRTVTFGPDSEPATDNVEPADGEATAGTSAPVPPDAAASETVASIETAATADETRDANAGVATETTESDVAPAVTATTDPVTATDTAGTETTAAAADVAELEAAGEPATATDTDGADAAAATETAGAPESTDTPGPVAALAPAATVGEAPAAVEAPVVWERADEASEKALALNRRARRQVQRRVKLLGFNPRGVDGVFGPGSRSAISAWQESRSIPTTGFLDAAQVAALNVQSETLYAAWQVEARRRRRERERASPIGRYVDRRGCLRERNGAYVPNFKAGCG